MPTSTLPYRCAVITGASSGIGEAIARRLALHPMHLVLIARRPEPLRVVADSLQLPPERIIILPLDVTEPDSDQHVLSLLTYRSLSPDLLVNNAGFGSYGFFHQLPADKQSDMIDLNIKAVVRWTHRFLQPMTRADHGAIINISSTAGFQPVPFMTTYAATKAFVTSFTMGLAAELRDTRIRVVNVCPGRTRTNFQVVAGSHRVKVRSHFATADEVARVAIRALQDNRSLVVEGFVNKLSVHLQRVFPRRTILGIARRIFKPRN